ncbi:MAG: hypothetical protein K6G26_04860 [Lachnospiraceae bacterium]|nr:hypothetical protein [Lachnospiraceae bacterium]
MKKQYILMILCFIFIFSGCDNNTAKNIKKSGANSSSVNDVINNSIKKYEDKNTVKDTAEPGNNPRFLT